MMASVSSAFAQGGVIQEKSNQERFASYSGVPAHLPAGRQVHRSLIARDPALDCEVREPESDTVDADLWVRLKLKYQLLCYKQAEALIHRRLQELSITNRWRLTSSNRRMRNLNTVGLFDRAMPDASTASRSVGADDAIPPPNLVSPTQTDKAAETTPSEGLPSNSVNDAKSYLEKGIASYRDGDLPAAIADFDLAIERDPKLKVAYIDQGVTWYRAGSSKRAFDDIAQAVRLENSP
jgi:tetratricopeptide (TPR) repeat protein